MLAVISSADLVQIKGLGVGIIEFKVITNGVLPLTDQMMRFD